MKIDILVHPGAEHQIQAAQALSAGLACHGDEGRIVATPDALQTPVVACWGWRKGKPLRAAGKRVLVMERGYVGDRFRWTSLGWDGLNGRARFPLVEGDFHRWDSVLGCAGLPPAAPGSAGSYALILGQVTGDASIEGVDIAAWYAHAYQALRKHGLLVFFRPHPVEIKRRGAAAMTACAGARLLEAPLEKTLAGAAVAAAYNSNALTDAVLAGVPVVAGDRGAMAWPVARQKFADHPESAGNVFEWAARLAWCQWLPEEIADGTAWEALKSCIEPDSGWSPSFAKAMEGRPSEAPAQEG